MTLYRVLKTTKVTVAYTFRVDDVPTDATGNVVVTTKRLDGTAVVAGSGNAGHVAADTGRYTFDLPASADLDTWSLDWAGTINGAAVVVRDYVEHVGGFLFDLSAAREANTSTARPWTGAAYSDAALAPKRISVEQEAEAIAHRAFVPRFARFALDGTGTPDLVVPDLDLRAVRAVSIASRFGQAYVALGAGELAAVAPLPSGILARDDGSVWPVGRRNVIVEYEYGLDGPPQEVTDQAIARMRYVVSAPKSAIPDRAISYTILEGGVYRLAQAGRRSTGSPDIDAAYQRNGHDTFWLAGRGFA